MKNAQIQAICFWPTQLMFVGLCFPTLELHGPWHTTCKLSCVIGCEAKDGAVSLYSRTWRYEESPPKMNKWKFYMVSRKWIMFEDLWGIVRSMTKRGILHKSWGHANRLNCHCSKEIMLPWWGPELENISQSLNMVHFHFTLSLRPH